MRTLLTTLTTLTLLVTALQTIAPTVYAGNNENRWGFSLCFRSHQMLIVLLRSRHGSRTVPGDVRELLDLGKLVSIAVRQAGGPVFGSN